MTKRVLPWGKAAAIGGSVLAGLVVVVFGQLLMAGCGQAAMPATTTDAIIPTSTSSSTTQVAPVPTTTAPSSSSSSTVTSAQGRPAGVGDVFKRVASLVRPMTVFVPTVLPEGAKLTERWFPVIDSADPLAYDGPGESNPRVLGSGPDSEIQAVFRAGQGWLVVIENFLGDLGDVTGAAVGSVAGNPATLFEINGGELVQWSRDGRWYGVFGRGLKRDAIVAVVLGMKVVSAESP